MDSWTLFWHLNGVNAFGNKRFHASLSKSLKRFSLIWGFKLQSSTLFQIEHCVKFPNIHKINIILRPSYPPFATISAPKKKSKFKFDILLQDKILDKKNHQNKKHSSKYSQYFNASLKLSLNFLYFSLSLVLYKYHQSLVIQFNFVTKEKAASPSRFKVGVRCTFAIRKTMNFATTTTWSFLATETHYSLLLLHLLLFFIYTYYSVLSHDCELHNNISFLFNDLFSVLFFTLH